MKKSINSVTLLELLISLAMIGVIIMSISSIGNTLYDMKKSILDKQQPVIQGTLATVIIFERVLRAVSNTPGIPAFTISDGCRHLQYIRSGINEEIWLEDNKIKYREGTNPDKIILDNVNNLCFTQDFNNRLAMDINLCLNEVCNETQNFRTAVQPRNEFVP